MGERKGLEPVWWLAAPALASGWSVPSARPLAFQNCDRDLCNVSSLVDIGSVNHLLLYN